MRPHASGSAPGSNRGGGTWEGNQVWFVTAGGAIFAAFPPVYATVFSGFYLAMMLVLVGLSTLKLR